MLYLFHNLLKNLLILAPEVDHLLFNLVLLAQEVLLHLVDPDVESLDIHLGLLAAVLTPLQLIDQLQDLRLNMGVRFGARVSKICSRAAERQSLLRPPSTLGEHFGKLGNILDNNLRNFVVFYNFLVFHAISCAQHI